MYLLGASGHAKVIIDILELNGVEIKGLFDKNDKIKTLGNYSVWPETEVKEHDELLISIGNNELRKKLALRFATNAYKNAVHPSACLAKSVKLGHGIAIMANTTINADTKIGNHCIINTAASVDHDCQIGDFVHVAPNTTICGGITIGEGTLVGAGAVIIPNLTIGKGVTIGAGAVVANDVPDGVTVVGNPAKIIKHQ